MSEETIAFGLVLPQFEESAVGHCPKMLLTSISESKARRRLGTPGQELASNLIAMASNQIAMASNLIAMASNLTARASNLTAMNAGTVFHSLLACAGIVLFGHSPSRFVPYMRTVLFGAFGTSSPFM